jgi:hypothetical protein
VTGRLRVWTALDVEAWDAAVVRAGRHDFCHLAGYHRVTESRIGGVARLFQYEGADITIALPLLVREVSGTPWRDATSVYGYAGPVGPLTPLEPAVLKDFHAQLRAALHDLSVISVFSRLHPLLDARHVAGLGSVRLEGETISIGLGPAGLDGREQYSASTRRTLQRLDRLGFRGIHDAEFDHLDDLTSIYQDTMRRAGAAPEYEYDAEDFSQLIAAMPGVPQLFVALHEDEVVAASLAMHCGTIVQDFLGGTRADYLKFSPDRLIVDTEREWALGVGADVLHLGGGRGARPDSLFHYKAGFSSRRHTFSTWRWVVDKDAYRKLVHDDGRDPEHTPYFPTYRDPQDVSES